jgi:pyruvate kinase
MRKTKIIATLGPASTTPKMIEKLLRAGADTFRFNFSHGPRADHLRRIRMVRAAAQKLNRPVAVLQDLQGPKIRLETFEKGSVLLKKNARFTITTRTVSGTEAVAGTTYKRLHRDVRHGNVLHLNDGLVRLKVLSVKGRDILTRVLAGGRLSDNKGVNLPGIRVSAGTPTPKDLDDLAFGIRHGVDYVALSFVRKASDVRRVKAFIARQGQRIPVIAKIEKPEAVADIRAILDAADGIMVARGDLGVEMSPEAVPAVQKQLIEAAREGDKIAITATQMLESMIENPAPTRAEASDVANAVYDGTDAIMLSAETASGKYPVEAVKMMHKIAAAAEIPVVKKQTGYFVSETDDTVTRAMTLAAQLACEEIKGRTIVVFTASGRTARLISKNKRDARIVALTPHKKIVNQLALVWGVCPLFLPYIRNTDRMIERGMRAVLKAGFVKKGEAVVLISGSTAHAGSTNMLKIVKI